MNTVPAPRLRRPPCRSAVGRSGLVLAWWFGACLGAAAQTAATTGRAPATPPRAAAGAAATLPAVNLWIELREVDDVVRDEPAGGRAATVVGTLPGSTSGGAVWSTSRPAEREPSALLAQLRLRNGGQAQTSWRRQQPVEWVSSTWAPGANAGGAAIGRPAEAHAGVSRELHWLPAGRQITVSATWPGGSAPVAVEVVVDAQSPDGAPTSGAVPPDTLQTRTAVSVLAPLDQWVTVARSATAEDAGSAPPPGSIGTRPAAAPAVALQLRVRATAPPPPPLPPALPPRR